MRAKKSLNSEKVFSIGLVIVVISMIANFCSVAWAVQLPGDDISGQMIGAGKLLRLIDTGLFNWGSKLLSGICIFSGGWHFKEMRIGPAIIAIIAAILIGTAPMWVRDIFNVAGSSSVFGT